MNAIRLTLRARRRRDQRGFTLVEILAALAIIAMVMVPVTGWALLSMRQHSEVEDRSTTSASAGLLRSYFMADVASASSIDPAKVPATCGSSGTQWLAVGPGPTAYVVDQMKDLDGNLAPGKVSVWRRECNGAALVAQQQVVEDIDETTVTVDCDGPPCNLIKFSVARVDDLDHPIVLSAKRRSTV